MAVLLHLFNSTPSFIHATFLLFTPIQLYLFVATSVVALIIIHFIACMCRFCIFLRKFSCFTWSYLSSIWSCNHMHSRDFIWSCDHLHMCYQESKMWDNLLYITCLNDFVLSGTCIIAHSCEFRIRLCDNGTKQPCLWLHQDSRNRDTSLWSHHSHGQLNTTAIMCWISISCLRAYITQ